VNDKRGATLYSFELNSLTAAKFQSWQCILHDIGLDNSLLALHNYTCTSCQSWPQCYDI